MSIKEASITNDVELKNRNGGLTDRKKVGTAIDRHDMMRMGKTQELRRNFRFFPILGFTAVLMCTWEAVLTCSSYILPNGGLAGMLWMYVVSVFGFGAAILSMAEMASMAPTSGGQYHWVSEFAPKSAQKILSFAVGWLCVLGWQAGVAGQSFAVGSQIQGMLILNYPDYVPEAYHATLITIAVATLAIIINTFFAPRLPLIEGLILIFHVFGFFGVMIPLWVTAPRHSSTEVWTQFSQTSEWPSMGVAVLVGLSCPVNALIGPDSAVHMSEEVQDASRTLPLAMVLALVINGITGFISTVTYAYCLGPLDAAIHPEYNFAFIGTFYNATQSHVGATLMSCIISTMTLCSAITNVATASRQMFAFARDNAMPFAGVLSHVRPGWDIPLNTVIVTWVITSLLSLINLGSNVTFNALVSLGIAALLSSYIVSISCILIKRLRRKPLLTRRWSLGSYGTPVNIVAIVYLVVAYIFAFFPVSLPVTAVSMNWACLVYSAIVIFSGAYYIFSARHKYVAPVSRLAKDTDNVLASSEINY